MPKYRFFICYSHAHANFATQVFDLLKDGGHLPFRDEMIPGGGVVVETIRWEIPRAHFFLPIIIGEEEAKSAWMHHEIGYAMACNIRVVPILENASLDLFPFIRDLNPIYGATESEIMAKLLGRDWDKDLNVKQLVGNAVFEYSTHAKHRTDLLAQVADKIHDRYGKDDDHITVWQRSSLTTFSLPRGKDDEIWENVPIDEYEQLWFNPSERLQLEDVGREFRLMIDPNLPKPLGSDYKPSVQLAKLRTLKAFLESQRKNVRVVIKPFEPAKGLTLIGDYWVLESATVAPSQQERHTLSTWHPPTVDEYVKNFKEEFDRLWNRKVQGSTPAQKLSWCIGQIGKAIAEVRELSPASA